MATPPLLTATPSGDVLELRPGGSWTAAYVTTLEALSDAVAAQLDRSKTVKVDMAEVRELDTMGAWLLEKMSRRATAAGHRADVAITHFLEALGDQRRAAAATAITDDSLIEIGDLFLDLQLDFAAVEMLRARRTACLPIFVGTDVD